MVLSFYSRVTLILEWIKQGSPPHEAQTSQFYCITVVLYKQIIIRRYYNTFSQHWDIQRSQHQGVANVTCSKTAVQRARNSSGLCDWDEKHGCVRESLIIAEHRNGGCESLVATEYDSLRCIWPAPTLITLALWAWIRNSGNIVARLNHRQSWQYVIHGRCLGDIQAPIITLFF